MKSIPVRFPVLTFCIALLFLAGCAVIKTKTPRYYVLSPMAGAETGNKIEPAGTGNISITIGPVSLPKYLRKAQIVTRTGNNELNLAEFDRWAGKVEEDIGRVIAENLSHMLATERVIAYPAISVSGTDYTIEMDISRFEGSLGENFEMIARWTIFDLQGKKIRSITSTRITEAVEGPGYAAMVAAQSQALYSLSRELADAIIKLSTR